MLESRIQQKSLETKCFKAFHIYRCRRPLKLLRKPSCGVRNLFRLGAPTNFDRCAILASLHPPQAALQRRCPARGFGANAVKQTAYRLCLEKQGFSDSAKITLGEMMIK
jgi:hypothetical protein